jgi:hypothetical protein
VKALSTAGGDSRDYTSTASKVAGPILIPLNGLDHLDSVSSPLLEEARCRGTAPSGQARMTSEVALLNQYAVALAADSAVTTTHWTGGRRQTRYFKGANKIFNISEKHPVGLMIYGAAALQGVPWEIIAKAYRSHRGDTPRDELNQYAHDLFDFVATNSHLFPLADQEKHLVSSIYDAFGRLTFIITHEIEEDVTSAGELDDNNKIVERFNKIKADIETAPFIDGTGDNFIKEAMQHKDAVLQRAAQGDLDYEKATGAVSADDIFEAAAMSVFKQQWTTFEMSGVVLAGYGETQYFPELLHHQCYAVVLGKLICEPVQNRSRIGISPQNTSAIEPLAQSDMVKTFIYGASPSALEKISELVQESMGRFEAALIEKGYLDKDIDLDAIRTDVSERFGKESSSYLFNSHTRPLRQVIGVLSIAEMADLAETLIAIESLKERVTKPTESISGPVDVAVISKCDGFVWIKRKHYFKAELNPRVIARKTHS